MLLNSHPVYSDNEKSTSKGLFNYSRHFSSQTRQVRENVHAIRPPSKNFLFAPPDSMLLQQTQLSTVQSGGTHPEAGGKSMPHTKIENHSLYMQAMHTCVVCCSQKMRAGNREKFKALTFSTRSETRKPYFTHKTKLGCTFLSRSCVCIPTETLQRFQ